MRKMVLIPSSGGGIRLGVESGFIRGNSTLTRNGGGQSSTGRIRERRSDIQVQGVARKQCYCDDTKGAASAFIVHA